MTVACPYANRMSRIVSALLVCALFAAGCGASESPTPTDPVEQVPDTPGLREAVREAQSPDVASFPDPAGKTLQQVADLVTAGPQAALASSVFTTGGENRFVFGVIAQDGKAVYGPTAIYIAPTPNEPAQGPFVAPADVLLTQPRYRSEQAARETDPFAAVYAAPVKFPKAGSWSVLVMTRNGGRLIGAPTQITVKTKAQDKIPDVGERGAEGRHGHARVAQGRQGAARHPQAAERHARRLRGASSARSRSRCCSARRSCASRACAARSPTSRCRCGRSTATRWSSSTRRSGRTTISRRVAAAAGGVQPRERAVAVRDRQEREGHRAARGLVRDRRVRERGEDRALAGSHRHPTRLRGRSEPCPNCSTPSARPRPRPAAPARPRPGART